MNIQACVQFTRPSGFCLNTQLQINHPGVTAIYGQSGAGKSTLLNLMIGSKVSIVTPKVQTTRTRITGICMAGQTQIVFLDTPGIFTPKRRLERAMVTAAWSGAHDADIVVVLIDANRGIDRDSQRIIDGLGEQKRTAILALNKIDTVRRDRLLPLADELQKTGIFTDTFMISALKGDGVDDLRTFLAGRMAAGPWLYPEDQLSDIPLRLLAAEVTREKLFLRLHQELPYALTVETEAWEERKDGSVKIDQIVYVLRDLMGDAEAEQAEPEFTQHELDDVKRKLKNLGYL